MGLVDVGDVLRQACVQATGNGSTQREIPAIRCPRGIGGQSNVEAHSSHGQCPDLLPDNGHSVRWRSVPRRHIPLQHHWLGQATYFRKLECQRRTPPRIPQNHLFVPSVLGRLGHVLVKMLLRETEVCVVLEPDDASTSDDRRLRRQQNELHTCIMPCTLWLRRLSEKII